MRAWWHDGPLLWRVWEDDTLTSLELLTVCARPTPELAAIAEALGTIRGELRLYARRLLEEERRNAGAASGRSRGVE